MKPEELHLQRREIEVLKFCKHPNIIKLLDIFENLDYIFIVLEYMQGGDLFTYLDEREFKITEDRARYITHMIASALYYLHCFGIVHRDLKLENILLVDKTDDSELKLVDFGLSTILGPNETATEPFGTMCYVAPEVLLQKPYGKNVDLWSLGVIIYIILSGMLPFDGDNNKEIAEKTIYSPCPFDNVIWQCVSTDGKDLIARLLEKDRFKRITLHEVLTHAWVCKRNKKMQQKRKNSDPLNELAYFAASDEKYLQEI
mmetsp:Transcript_3398/g.2358  ORF Transcript_3398/g.2358 Transcript_3398/m.2358 type:complete len:258 (+) Transcript_3398:221-994(+)